MGSHSVPSTQQLNTPCLYPAARQASTWFIYHALTTAPHVNHYTVSATTCWVHDVCVLVAVMLFVTWSSVQRAMLFSSYQAMLRPRCLIEMLTSCWSAPRVISTLSTWPAQRCWYCDCLIMYVLHKTVPFEKFYIYGIVVFLREFGHTAETFKLLMKSLPKFDSFFMNI